MKLDFREQLEMFYAVDSLNKRYESFFAESRVYRATQQELDEKLADIEDVIDIKSAPTKQATILKAETRTVLIDKVLYSCKRLSSYATVLKDKLLLDEYAVSPSSLKNMRDAELESFSRRIILRIEPMYEQLGDYGLTPDFVELLKSALAAFSEAAPKVRETKMNSKLATSSLESLMKSTMDLLTQRMDLDIEMFKESNPDFFKQYWASREMSKHTARASMLNIHVCDDETGEPIKNALLTITSLTDPTFIIQRRTTDKGRSRVDSLPEGQYLLTTEKIGMVKDQTPFTVAKGERTVVEVRMRKA